MRQDSRKVLTRCQVPLSQGKKYVAVTPLTGHTLYCVVEVKDKVQEVFSQMSTYLGMKDTCLFGLALPAENEYFFVGLNTKISKYAPKQWKSLSSMGLDGTGKPMVHFYLRIQFYVDCHLLIRDKVTRYHYYLQLKENVLKHSQTSQEERSFLLGAHALQVDLGSYDPEKCAGKYFRPKDYFPPWVINRFGEDYIIQNVPEMHKDNRHLSRSEAQMAFIKEASSPEAPHNLHLYRLKKKKNDSKETIWLGICPKGIEVYEDNEEGTSKQLWSTFMWSDISKLAFEKKKFEIRAISYADTRKYSYYAKTDEKAKFMLHLCKATHQFVVSVQPTVEELRKFEQQKLKKSYRESYIYSDNFDLEWEQERGALNMSLHDFSTLPKTGKGNDQRISVISNTSSNTTSGIVSDPIQSLDGSEDDLEDDMMTSAPTDVADSPRVFLTVSDQEDGGYDGQSLNAEPINCTDLDLSSSQLTESVPSSATSTLPHSRSKLSSTAVSRADSSSSQQSGSTVKSRSQPKDEYLSRAELFKSTSVFDVYSEHAYSEQIGSGRVGSENVVDSKRVDVISASNNNDSRSSSPVYFLPKMEPLERLGFSSSSNDNSSIFDRKSDLFDRNSSSTVPRAMTSSSKGFLLLQDDEISTESSTDHPNSLPIQSNSLPPVPKPRPSTTTMGSTSTFSGSRILTSMGGGGIHVSTISPSQSLPTPQPRTKIGISSLSRQTPLVIPSGTPAGIPSRAFSSTIPPIIPPPAIPPRPVNSYRKTTTFSPVTNTSVARSSIIHSTPVVLPPTAMYGIESSQYVSPQVINTNGSNHHYYSSPNHPNHRLSYQFERMALHSSLQTIPSSPLDNNPNSIFSHNNSHSLPETVDYSSCSSDSTNAFSFNDVLYIPPPPLYANPTLSNSYFVESRPNGSSNDLSNGPPHVNGYTSMEFSSFSGSPYFQMPLIPRPSVSKGAWSEERCRSLETVAAHPNVSVGRAQSMNRGPISDLARCDLTPVSLSYFSKSQLNGASPCSSVSSVRTTSLGSTDSGASPLDIDNLRKKSKDLDLPLISALCNDSSLVNTTNGSQTSISSIPINQHRRLSCETPPTLPLAAVSVSSPRPLSWHVSSEVHWPLSHASSSDGLPQRSSPAMMTSTPAYHHGRPFASTIMTSFGKNAVTGMSPKHSPANSSSLPAGQQQLFPMKLSLLGRDANNVNSNACKANS